VDSLHLSKQILSHPGGEQKQVFSSNKPTAVFYHNASRNMPYALQFPEILFKQKKK